MCRCSRGCYPSPSSGWWDIHFVSGPVVVLVNPARLVKKVVFFGSLFCLPPVPFSTLKLQDLLPKSASQLHNPALACTLAVLNCHFSCHSLCLKWEIFSVLVFGELVPIFIFFNHTKSFSRHAYVHSCLSVCFCFLTSSPPICLNLNLIASRMLSTSARSFHLQLMLLNLFLYVLQITSNFIFLVYFSVIPVIAKLPCLPLLSSTLSVWWELKLSCFLWYTTLPKIKQ